MTPPSDVEIDIEGVDNTFLADVRTRLPGLLEAGHAAIVARRSEADPALFVEHHLQTLPDAVWARLGGRPDSAEQLLDLLVPISLWGEQGRVVLDFTLPGDVTDYVLGVAFDDAWTVDEVVMES